MACGQGGTNPERREFTVSVVFVMSKDSAPPEGELVGDILYVPVPEGYRNIVLKTKAMLCLVRPPPPPPPPLVGSVWRQSIRSVCAFSRALPCLVFCCVRIVLFERAGKR